MAAKNNTDKRPPNHHRVNNDKVTSPKRKNSMSSLSPTRKKSVKGVGLGAGGAVGGVAGGGGVSPTKKPPGASTELMSTMNNASTVIAIVYLDGEEVGKTGVCSSEHPDSADPLWLWESEVFYLRIPCTLLNNDR